MQGQQSAPGSSREDPCADSQALLQQQNHADPTQMQSPDAQENVPHQPLTAAAMNAAEPQAASHLPRGDVRQPLRCGVQIDSRDERDAILAVLEGHSADIDEGAVTEAGPSRQPAQEALVGEAEWAVTCIESGRDRSGLQHRFHVKVSTGSMRLSQTICCSE